MEMVFSWCYYMYIGHKSKLIESLICKFNSYLEIDPSMNAVFEEIDKKYSLSKKIQSSEIFDDIESDFELKD